MPSNLVLGLDILLLIVLWKVVLRKSILDHHRDRLFDLRDSVREYFVRRSVPLSSPIYMELRDLINAHLRFIDDMNLTSVFVYSSEVDRNPELGAYLKEQIDKRFSTRDENLIELVESTRCQAVLILTQYMVQSSLILMAVVAARGILSIACGIFRRVLLKRGKESRGIDSIVRADLLEEFSYSSSSSGRMKPA